MMRDEQNQAMEALNQVIRKITKMEDNDYSEDNRIIINQLSSELKSLQTKIKRLEQSRIKYNELEEKLGGLKPRIESLHKKNKTYKNKLNDINLLKDQVHSIKFENKIDIKWNNEDIKTFKAMEQEKLQNKYFSGTFDEEIAKKPLDEKFKNTLQGFLSDNVAIDNFVNAYSLSKDVGSENIFINIKNSVIEHNNKLVKMCEALDKIISLEKEIDELSQELPQKLSKDEEKVLKDYDDVIFEKNNCFKEITDKEDTIQESITDIDTQIQKLPKSIKPFFIIVWWKNFKSLIGIRKNTINKDFNFSNNITPNNSNRSGA